MLYYIYVFNTLSIKQSTNNHECASPCTKPLRYKKKKTFVGKWNVPISTYCHISRDHFLDNRTGQYSQKNHSRKSFNEKWKVKARGIIQIGQA